jgi:hypothetical protein
MIIKDKSKSSEIFRCELCDYTTSRISQINRHLLTVKHTMITNGNNKVPKKIYECDCGKKYKYISGLSRHKTKCCWNLEPLEPSLESNNLQELVIKLITDNQEMKKENQKLINTLISQHQQLTEIIPQIGNGNNNNSNNIKQKFNISVFLNEKCKDAISMNEFVEKIEISMKNLLITKDKGLGEGLSNIIIENMNKLSLYERPMHCTDKKRETIYIKNEEWEKDEGNEKINKFLRNVEHKQLQNIEQWTDKHPNYMNNETQQEEYLNLVKGCTSSIDHCKNKVIRKLCDNVYLTEKE